MKRTIVLVLILVVMTSMLAGCKPDPELTVFCDWISLNGFAPDMGQTAFANLISTFYMDGKPLREEGEFYQVTGGTGYSVGTNSWGLTHESSEGKTYNYFYIHRNLDNLELPGGVLMGDTKDTCMEKLGLEGKALEVKDITVGRSTCEMNFTDNVLHFQESYDWYTDDGKVVKVTRVLIFKFINSELNEFSVTITEKW